MRQFRSVMAIALLWAIAFPLTAHARPKRLRPPQPKQTLVKITPLSDYAQKGLEVAISKGWVAQYSPYADRLRIAVSALRTGDVEQASARSGVKPQVIDRLINVGMIPTIPVAATPESQKNIEVPDEDDDF